MDDLNGRVAIITGASQGLGFDMAHALADEGVKLVVTGRVAATIEARADELRALGADAIAVAGDVGQRATADRTVARALEAFGRIDILVNNAQTLTLPIPLMEQDDAHMQAVIGSGLFGSMYFMQAAYPTMKRQGGAIINIGSSQGVVGSAGTASYAAAKEGIRGLTRVAAREWGRDNIRVNVVCPGAWSPSYENWFRGKPDELAEVLAQKAMGRVADGYRDLGALVIFLAGDRCFLTGQTLYCDGGAIMF